MKKSSKSSLKNKKKKKRSLDTSLQHKNEASYKFSKKNFCTWLILGLGLKGLTEVKAEQPWSVYDGCFFRGLTIAA